MVNATPIGTAYEAPTDPLDPVTELRRRVGARSLRMDDRYDSRARVWRWVVKLAALRDPDLDELGLGVANVFTADEPPKLEAVFGIPERWETTDRDRRDAWLRRASQPLSDRPMREAARELVREWARFHRLLWPVWRDLDDAPLNASDFDRALLYATRYCGGRLLGERQVANVIAPLWDQEIENG